MLEIIPELSSLIDLFSSQEDSNFFQTFHKSKSYFSRGCFNNDSFNCLNILRYFVHNTLYGSNGLQIMCQFLNIGNPTLWLFSFLIVGIQSILTTKKTNRASIYCLKHSKQTILVLIILLIKIIFSKGCFNIQNEHKKPLLRFLQIERITKKIISVQLLPLLLTNKGFFVARIWCEAEIIDMGRSYVKKNINISHCFFSRSSVFYDYGSVIYVSDGGSYSMNVNYSMFYNCASSSSGGAIHFTSTNSYLRMICANRCFCGSSNGGQFAYLSVYQANQVEFSSVSNCSYTTSGCYPIYIQSGNQRVDNTNSSMNNAKMDSGIRIYSPSSFSSSYCTFSNNKASDFICIFIYATSGIITMSYANIVHNNSPVHRGVVCVDGTVLKKMQYCIFQNNQNTLFCVWDGSLEVSHSFIDHSSSLSLYTAVSTASNNSFANRMTYQVQYFQSYYCNAQLPAPVPSPMRTLFGIQTPQETLEKSPMKSIEETKSRTNQETYSKTVMNTIDQTKRVTPVNTLEKTPMKTLKESPFITNEVTHQETQKETIHRSYADCIFTREIANLREVSVVFSFSFIFPIVILMIS